MSLVTRCPACSTTYRVRPEQLAARAGKVRCGKCTAVFDGVQNLLAEEAAAGAFEHSPQLGLFEAARAAQSAAAQPDRDAVAGSVRDTPATARPAARAAAPTPRGDVTTAMHTGTSPASTRDEPARTTQPAAAAPVIEVNPASDEAPVQEPAAQPAVDLATAGTFAPRIAATDEPAILSAAAVEEEDVHPTGTTGEEPAFLVEPPVVRSRYRVLWGFLSVLALVGLSLQAVVHYRVELAYLAPDARPLIRGACELFGCTLRLAHRPELMSIEASDLQTDPQRPREVLLTALIRNRAPYPQEYPALELTLTDESDRAVARRVLTAHEYLGAARADALVERGIAPAAEALLEVRLSTERVDATGYRLYLFFPPSP